MPEVTVTWNISAEHLQLMAPFLVRKLNRMTGNDFAQPGTPAQLAAILKPTLGKLMKEWAHTQRNDDEIPALKEDIQNEMEQIELT
jgi:hypothetical protein